MTNANEKSITVIRMPDPTLRYYMTSWVLAEAPDKMQQAQQRLDASTLFTEVSPVNFNTFEVAVDQQSAWTTADETMLANLMTGLGWAEQEVVIYDRTSNSPDRTRRETAMAIDVAGGPLYRIVATA